MIKLIPNIIQLENLFRTFLEKDFIKKDPEWHLFFDTLLRKVKTFSKSFNSDLQTNRQLTLLRIKSMDEENHMTFGSFLIFWNDFINECTSEIFVEAAFQTYGEIPYIERILDNARPEQITKDERIATWGSHSNHAASPQDLGRHMVKSHFVSQPRLC